MARFNLFIVISPNIKSLQLSRVLIGTCRTGLLHRSLFPIEKTQKYDHGHAPEISHHVRLFKMFSYRQCAITPAIPESILEHIAAIGRFFLLRNIARRAVTTFVNSMIR